MKRNISLILFTILFSAVFGTSNVFAYSFIDNDDLKLDLYGKLYLDAFYTSASENHSSGEASMSRKSGVEFNMLNFSKVGVKVQYKNLESVAEFGTSPDGIIRLLYAQYTFNNGSSLLFGQAATIAGYSFGQLSYNQNCLIDYGTLDTPRRPMVKYSIKGVSLALISGKGLPIMGQDASYTYLNDVADEMNSTNQDGNVTIIDWIPRFEIAYHISSKIFNGKVFGSYAPYVMQSKKTSGSYGDYYLNTYSVGAGGQFDIGKAYIQVSAYYGMNLTLTKNLFNPLNPGIKRESDNALTMLNVESAGGAIGFGYRINDILTPQIGGGFSRAFGGPIDNFDDAFGIYANVIVKVYDWLSLTPEIAYLDNMYDGNGSKQGNKIFAGIQMEISF